MNGRLSALRARIVGAETLDASTERVVDVGGTALPLTIRRNPRAKRMILRMSPCGRLTLTLPRGVAVADGLVMIERERRWIARRVGALPPRQPFADGVHIPFLGEPHLIRHRPERRRGIVREAGCINVGGPAEFLEMRLTRWLRAAALAELSRRSTLTAARLGRPIRTVRVRDMRTRWGSCSAHGDLNYNWRLILAPPFVVDYVVAHEVAHLAWRDHGAAFWATVAGLTDDVAAAKAWLRAEGSRLLAFG